MDLLGKFTRKGRSGPRVAVTELVCLESVSKDCESFTLGAARRSLFSISVWTLLLETAELNLYLKNEANPSCLGDSCW